MQNLAVQALGLYTNPSPTMVPQGSLLEAENIVIDRPGLMEQRRGLKRYGTVFTGTPNSLFNYRDRIIAHEGSTLNYDSDGAGAWSAYSGSYSAAGTKIRSIEAGGSFYFTSSAGVYKLDSLTGTPALAGIPEALNGSAVLSAAGSGFFTVDNMVAYRVVWGKKDAQGITLKGAPSGRFTVSNPALGASDTVAVTFVVPPGITTSHFWQLYRSDLSGGAAIEPNDELQLVAQAFWASGATVTYTDITPTQLMGPLLYTNESQEGILQSNYRPPYAKDMAQYHGFAFYANTKQKQFLDLSLIGAGSPGLQVNDTITFTSGASTFTITAKGTENTAAGEFLLSTGGSVTANIIATSASIVNVVNLYASNTFLSAFYTSSYNDAPGSIRFQARLITQAAFSVVQSAHGISWIPNLPTSGTSIISGNDEKAHRVYYSKEGEPGSVPLMNYLDCGSEFYGIDRIVALRDSIFIFKADGLYRIMGDNPSSFRSVLFDSSCALLGVDTPAVFDNQIFFVSDEGIAMATESGVQIIGQRVENLVLPLWAGSYPAVNTAFGVAYESARKYILFLVDGTADAQPTSAIVYHQVSNQFTQWTLSAYAGIVNSADDKLYLFKTDKYVHQERKTLSYQDYADNSFAATIASSSTVSTPMTIALVNGGNGYRVGDTFYITGGDGNAVGRVTAINSSAGGIGDGLNFGGGGTNYTPGDTFTVDSGTTLATGIVDTTVPPLQAVSTFHMTSPGSGYILTQYNTTVTSGPGSGFRIDVTELSGIATAVEVVTTGTRYSVTASSATTLIPSGPGSGLTVAVTSVPSSGSQTTTVTLSSSTGVTAGMFLSQNLTRDEIISVSGNNLTMDSSDITWATGACEISEPIQSRALYNPINFGDPTIIKQIMSMVGIFNTSNFNKLYIGFKTNLSNYEEKTLMVPLAGVGWGMTPWGSSPWGGGFGGAQNIRTLIHREKQWAHWIQPLMENTDSFSQYGILGLSLQYEPMSEVLKT